MAWTNEDVARQFAEIVTLLKLSGADQFRVRAYERAAGAIGAAPTDLATLDEAGIAALRGIGASTARKVSEYLTTGKIAMLEDLRGAVPAGLVELIRVPGLGPKTARLLYDSLGINSVEALREAIETERLRGLPGLGVKTEANLRDAIARVGAKDTGRVPMADAVAVAEELCRRLRELPVVEDVTYAGSLRRMRETIGDIDILAASTAPAHVHDALRSSELVTDVLAAGDKKTSVIVRRGIQADLRVVAPEAYGAALIYFTGSKDHNVRIRERAVRSGLTLNEYGLFDKETERRLECRTEAEVYEQLGLPFIPPPMREDTGEVQAAVAGNLPAVVHLEDIRGDLHGHSDWSGDGKATLEEMVAAAAGLGYEYWAVTDHAEGLPMNGLSRQQMLQRRTAIEMLQERYDIRILEGAELNIGPEGDVDYDPQFLATLDFCVASIHTLMTRAGAVQTRRIITAMENPAVHAIGHLTGRKIGGRPPYDVDLDAILDAAKRTGTALEVNASPHRLDISSDMVRRAVEAGVTLTISCDGHSVGDLRSMRYGVGTAQRGWATSQDVLNCRPLDGLFDFVAAKRT
ncbi:MAG: DNA polymerase/3'-5' exonuclease PolX [Nitriliruptorales bacterium]|nr:DNA polymerase/3'-5' exonuclease PolX [Nitriliruptorales bacterium]